MADTVWRTHSGKRCGWAAVAQIHLDMLFLIMANSK